VQILLADPRSLHTCHRPDAAALPGHPFKAMKCQETPNFKEMCKYYSKIAELQLFLSEWKRYEIVPTLAAIVTSCHSSGCFASLGNMFFLSSNNSTASTLYFLQIFAVVHTVCL
jgi:hypothetical protein